jgi:hypothetical protein
VKRREFFTVLGSAAAWPLGASAQQAGKLPTVGFLGTTTPSIMSQWTAAFVGRLRELGWIERDALSDNRADRTDILNGRGIFQRAWAAPYQSFIF